MDTKLVEKTRNKLKHELSSEELEALRRCDSTIKTHTRIGSILGGSLSIYGMYRRKLWPLRKYWGRGLFFGIGGIVVGMQLGLVTASIQCVKIVKSLPNPDHVMKALREIQVELQDARRRPLQGEREWSQRDENEATPSDAFNREGTSFGQDTRTEREERASTVSSWDQPELTDSGANRAETRPEGVYNGPGPSSPIQSQEAANRGSVGNQKEQSQNIWQQIRGENGGRPETAWDRLRKGGPSTEGQKSGQGLSPLDQTQPVVDDSMSGRNTGRAEMESAEKERLRQQSEFDRLLEQERLGTMDDGGRAKRRVL